MERLNARTVSEPEDIKENEQLADPAVGLEADASEVHQTTQEQDELPDYGPIRVSAFGPNIYGDFHN